MSNLISSPTRSLFYKSTGRRRDGLLQELPARHPRRLTPGSVLETWSGTVHFPFSSQELRVITIHYHTVCLSQAQYSTLPSTAKWETVRTLAVRWRVRGHRLVSHLISSATMTSWLLLLSQYLLLRNTIKIMNYTQSIYTVIPPSYALITADLPLQLVRALPRE